jgi:hypothetical protein
MSSRSLIGKLSRLTAGVIALAVTHPNRATKIIPLFSGNCAR